ALLAQEDALELHHAGIGEQQGGIVAGNQRRRRHLAVPPGGKIVEEETANLFGAHPGIYASPGVNPKGNARTRNALRPSIRKTISPEGGYPERGYPASTCVTT